MPSLRLRVRNQTHAIELRVQETGTFSVVVDGLPPRVVDIQPVPGGFHALVDGKSMDLMLDNLGASARVVTKTATLELEVTQPAAHLASSVRHVSTNIRAPMPGRIVQVFVKAGDVVEERAPLLVMEAMKMENNLCAPHALCIDTVHVEPGQSVERGALLLSLKGADLPA